MWWAAVCLVTALQLGSEFISESLLVSSADPLLSDLDETDTWRLQSWVSVYQTSPSCMQVWSLSTAQGSLSLCKQPAGTFLVCQAGICVSTSGSGELFNWEFVSVSVNKDILSVCTSMWTPRSLTCTTSLIVPFTLDSSTSILVPAELDLYDLQLHTAPLGDVWSVLSQYSCHSVCVSCFGPSFTSCEEFFPLVNLHSTLSLTGTESQSFTSGDREFRGRTYDSLSEHAVTGWLKIATSNTIAGWCELIRFTKTSDDYCATTPYSTVPALGYLQSTEVIHPSFEVDTGDCEDYISQPVSSVGVSSLVGVWLYFALINKVPHTFSCALFNSAAASSQTTPRSLYQLRQWNTLGNNHIKLGNKERLSCNSALKFKDVRVYTDLSSASLPVAPFEQLKVNCQSNCLACSDVEVCSSCEAGFYLEGGFCKGCSINCKTCSGPSSCLSCAAEFILSPAGSCGRTCPSGSFAEESRCQVCPSSCQTCISSEQCTLCKADFYQLELNGSVSCLLVCSQGYFTDRSNCKPCASSCKTCTGSTEADCSECAQDFYLVRGKCSQCSADAFYDGQDCLACNSQCKSCSSSQACDSCHQGLTLSKGVCVAVTCGSGEYLDEQGCSECPAICESCANEGSCGSCKGKCDCGKAYVLEDICRVFYDVKTDENAVLLLGFSSPLKPGLSSQDITLITELQVAHALRPTDSSRAYYLDVEFTPTPTSLVTFGVVVTGNITDIYDVLISQTEIPVSFNFNKTNNTSSKPATQSASQITSTALIASAALAGMFMGSPQSMFLLLNMLQFASLIPLMHFSLSDELSSLLTGNNPFNNLSNLSTLVLKPSWFPEPYSKAKHYGFETAGFFFNIGQELSVLVSLFLVLLGLFVGSKIACCFSLKLYCSKKLTAFKASLIPGFLQGCFQELLVAVMVQLKSQEYRRWYNALSCLSALTILVIAFLGSLLLVYVALRSPMKLSSFFSGSSALERLQVPAFYIHRLVCILTITLSTEPLVQGFVCLSASLVVISRQKFLLVLTVVLLKKPNWAFLMIETADWFSVAVLLLYAFLPSLEDSLEMLNIFYGLIFSTLAVSAASNLYQLVLYCRQARPSKVEI